MKLTLTQKSPSSRSFFATVLFPTPPGPDRTNNRPGFTAVSVLTNSLRNSFN